MSTELAPDLCPPAERSADCSLDRLTEALEQALCGEEPADLSLIHISEPTRPY